MTTAQRRLICILSEESAILSRKTRIESFSLSLFPHSDWHIRVAVAARHGNHANGRHIRIVWLPTTRSLLFPPPAIVSGPHRCFLETRRVRPCRLRMVDEPRGSPLRGTDGGEERGARGPRRAVTCSRGTVIQWRGLGERAPRPQGNQLARRACAQSHFFGPTTMSRWATYQWDHRVSARARAHNATNSVLSIYTDPSDFTIHPILYVYAHPGYALNYRGVLNYHPIRDTNSTFEGSPI